MTIAVKDEVRVIGRPELVGVVREIIGAMAFVEFPGQQELVGVKLAGIEPVQ